MPSLRDFLPPFRRSTPEFSAPLAPDQAFVAIGDVHGRFDLLTQLLAQIDDQEPTLPKVFVGDYIDRGPESAAVLRHVMTLAQDARQGAMCLKGNHEAMFLDFIDTPVQAGRQWLRNGGASTLESFGVEVPEDRQDEDALRAARDALIHSVGDEVIIWLRGLPLIWRTGNVIVTHAGGDPSQPIEPRRGHGLLWGHPDFLRKQRQDGIWIVHGHYIVPTAYAEHGRIAVDTGAHSTDKLSAAIVSPDGTARFLHT